MGHNIYCLFPTQQRYFLSLDATECRPNTVGTEVGKTYNLVLANVTLLRTSFQGIDR